MENLTIKQEKFALKLFECGNASEAYRYAYSTTNMKDKTVWERASVLASDNKVTARLNELKAQAEANSKWTVDKLIEKHEEIINIGLGLKATPHAFTLGLGGGESTVSSKDLKDTNLGSAQKSLIEIGKLLGLYRKDNTLKSEFSLKDFVKAQHERKKISKVDG